MKPYRKAKNAKNMANSDGATRFGAILSCESDQKDKKDQACMPDIPGPGNHVHKFQLIVTLEMDGNGLFGMLILVPSFFSIQAWRPSDSTGMRTTSSSVVECFMIYYIQKGSKKGVSACLQITNLEYT